MVLSLKLLFLSRQRRALRIATLTSGVQFGLPLAQSLQDTTFELLLLFLLVLQLLLLLLLLPLGLLLLLVGNASAATLEKELIPAVTPGDGGEAFSFSLLGLSLDVSSPGDAGLAPQGF